MSEKSMSALIGNVKRNYPVGDFNPFEVMDFVYENCLVMGDGSKVVLLGYSERFSVSIIPAMHHVMASRKILKKGPIPYPIAGEILSHTGTIIRFANVRDSRDEQSKMIEELDRATIAIVCNPYRSAEMKQVIRSKTPVMKIYNLSENNLEKG